MRQKWDKFFEESAGSDLEYSVSIKSFGVGLKTRPDGALVEHSKYIVEGRNFKSDSSHSFPHTFTSQESFQHVGRYGCSNK